MAAVWLRRAIAGRECGAAAARARTGCFPGACTSRDAVAAAAGSGAALVVATGALAAAPASMTLAGASLLNTERAAAALPTRGEPGALAAACAAVSSASPPSLRPAPSMSTGACAVHAAADSALAASLAVSDRTGCGLRAAPAGAALTPPAEHMSVEVPDERRVVRPEARCDPAGRPCTCHTTPSP